ncbi:MAG: hypothetical protein ACO3GP_08870, partial [Candidatus Limnocylindrus sp.]
AQLRARFDKFAQGMTQQPETQEPTAPEVIEEPTATIVSESAPAEVQPEAISEESAPADSTEQVTEQPAEVEQPAEPQAKASAADAILAKYNEILARAEAAEAHAKAIESRLEIVKGELATKCEDLDRLERSLGLSPARVVPAVDQVQDSGSIYDQWKNATGAEKTRIFRANRKALEAHAKSQI